MSEQRPQWLTRVLWFYSAWFRYGGLAFAILSGLFLVMMAVTIFRGGYVAVNGSQSRAWSALGIALGVPVLGVVFGLALFKLVPRVELPRRGTESRSRSSVARDQGSLRRS